MNNNFHYRDLKALNLADARVAVTNGLSIERGRKIPGHYRSFRLDRVSASRERPPI
jgi:hypothetical protein